MKMWQKNFVVTIFDRKDAEGKTRLHYAAETNDVRTLMQALAEFANVDILDKEGKSALQVALEHGSSEFLRLILESGCAKNNLSNITLDINYFGVEKTAEICSILLENQIFSFNYEILPGILDKLKENEIQFTDLLEGLESYSDNLYMLENLKNLKLNDNITLYEFFIENDKDILYKYATNRNILAFFRSNTLTGMNWLIDDRISMQKTLVEEFMILIGQYQEVLESIIGPFYGKVDIVTQKICSYIELYDIYKFLDI